MNKPSCIHLPVLLKNQPATIHWGLCDGAQGYQLERRLALEDQDFPLGYELIHRGTSPTTDYTHRGLRWGQIHASARTVSQIHASAHTWKRIASFGDAVSESHAFFADHIPEKAARAEYRVKAYGPEGESDYRYSAIQEVFDHSPVDDEMELGSIQGSLVEVLVVAEKVIRFPPRIHIQYAPNQLQLEHTTEFESAVTARNSGLVEFRSLHEIPEDSCYSGPLLLLRFRLLQTGKSRVKMF